MSQPLNDAMRDAVARSGINQPRSAVDALIEATLDAANARIAELEAALDEALLWNVAAKNKIAELEADMRLARSNAERLEELLGAKNLQIAKLSYGFF